jgi:hypothetical protein
MTLSLLTPWGTFSADLCSAAALWFTLVSVVVLFCPVSVHDVSQQNGPKPNKTGDVS